MALAEDKLIIGPKEGVHYPLEVVYCGNCTMPIEVNINLSLLLFLMYIDHIVVLRILS